MGSVGVGIKGTCYEVGYAKIVETWFFKLNLIGNTTKILWEKYRCFKMQSAGTCYFEENKNCTITPTSFTSAL